MANTSFASLVKLIAAYVGEAKASGLVERRLGAASVTADQFTKAHLSASMQAAIVSAATLYLLDQGKEAQLKSQLAMFARQ